MLQRGMGRFEDLAELGDDQLEETVMRLARTERASIALLVAALALFDARRLYLRHGYSSLFDFCTRALHLSEQAAYTRIAAARISLRFPIILDRIADGGLSLTATRLLAPHLTDDNLDELLDRARHQKTRDVERLVAAASPREQVPTVIRKVPQAPPGAPQLALASGAVPPVSAPPGTPRAPCPPSVPASRRPVVRPLSETHYKVQITISKSAHDKLREAQSLLRHVLPNGDPAAVIERALDALLIQVRKSKHASVARPRGGTGAVTGRRIPSRIKRLVWARDGGRCAFVGADGIPCRSQDFVEYHHLTPFARGGKATAENLQLRCRAHNAYEAALAFGPQAP